MCGGEFAKGVVRPVEKTTGRFLKNYFADKVDDVYGTYHTAKDEYENDLSMLYFDVEHMSGIQDILGNLKPDVVVSCLRGDFEKQLQVHRYIISYLQQVMHGKLVFLST